MRRFIMLALIMTSSIIYAQISSGSLVLEVTEASMEMEGGDKFGEMMKGMTMTMHFTPEHQVTATKMNMMGMSMNIKQYFEEGKMTQYMDMMGQKMKFSTDIDDLKKNGVDIEPLNQAYDITYDMSDTKMILGYKCHRANITMDLESLVGDSKMPDGMQDISLIAYVTEEIKMNQFSLKQFKGLQFEGTPMLMIMDMGMMNMTYEATSFNKEVDKNAFAYPEGDYREMSMEELQQMGSGGSGMGF